MKKSLLVIGILMLSGLCCAMVSADESCPTSMRSYWKFDDFWSVSTAEDTADGRNGTIYGASYASGRVAFSLDFDGNDYVSVADNDVFSFGSGLADGSFSVGAWVYFDESLTKQRIISKADATNNGEWLLTTNGVPV